MTSPEPDRARITIRVSPELRRRARMVALNRDETLQQLAERALVTELETCEDEAKAKASG